MLALPAKLTQILFDTGVVISGTVLVAAKMAAQGQGAVNITATGAILPDFTAAPVSAPKPTCRGDGSPSPLGMAMGSARKGCSLLVLNATSPPSSYYECAAATYGSLSAPVTRGCDGPPGSGSQGGIAVSLFSNYLSINVEGELMPGMPSNM